MPYNILLLPLLGGYVFVTRCYRTRWYARRAERERLLIYAALAGASHLALAFLWLFIYNVAVNHISSLAWLRSIHGWWNTSFPFPYSGTALIAFSIGSLGWIPFNAISDVRHGGKPWPWPKEQRKGKDAAAEKVIQDYGGPLELTLFNSLRYEKHVLLTLKNGKVYVGIIAEMFTPDDKIIYLWPQQSGYRDAKQRLKITTNYAKAYTQISELELDYTAIIRDFRVAIPVDYVTSATLYSAEIHEKYFPHEQIYDEPLEMD